MLDSRRMEKICRNRVDYIGGHDHTIPTQPPTITKIAHRPSSGPWKLVREPSIG